MVGERCRWTVLQSLVISLWSCTYFLHEIHSKTFTDALIYSEDLAPTNGCGQGLFVLPRFWVSQVCLPSALEAAQLRWCSAESEVARVVPLQGWLSWLVQLCAFGLAWVVLYRFRTGVDDTCLSNPCRDTCYLCFPEFSLKWFCRWWYRSGVEKL